MNVSEAVTKRQSVRGFLDRDVDLSLLRELIEKAFRAPSGGNIQPWHIHVVAENRLAELKAAMARRIAEAPGGEGTEYDIYPKELTAPYRDRIFEVGQLLYARLGIPRDDKAGRARWFARNFAFFGAPVGLFCYVDRRHGPPQWSDLGMYLQTLMLLLTEHGLASCAQECWALYHRTIGEFLDVPSDHMLFTGMSIGWPDPDAPDNDVRTPRAPIDEVVKFHIDPTDAGPR